MVFGPLCSKNGYRFYFYFGLKEGIVLPEFKLSMFLGTYRFENGSGLKKGMGKNVLCTLVCWHIRGGGYSANSCRIPTEQFPDK